MVRDSLQDSVAVTASRIGDHLDAEGHIALREGVSLISYLTHNMETLGDAPAYRCVDYSLDRDGVTLDLSWHQLDVRTRAVAARLQQLTQPGDRVAILNPHGLDYIIGFFAAIRAGNIAVPLFAPELPGHAERLEAVLTDAKPAVVLTTTSAAEAIRTILRAYPALNRPKVIAVDALPDAVGASFTPVVHRTDDIAYLQYTSGSTRTPAGVEISHRSVCTNVLQMAIAGGLDMSIRSVSWLPLYHDMGLIMIMFPALSGGYLTLMSPLAFVRRPHRWIKELAAEAALGRTFAAAPNFAFELAAQRGLPAPGESLDLTNVVGLFNGSEPVSMAAIDCFNAAFGPYGLPATAIKPSYGMAEATLCVATIAPDVEATAIYLDREQLGDNIAVQVAPDAPGAVALVSCGHCTVSQWAVIADSASGAELPDGRIGEIWLQGDNVGAGYWGRERETEITFKNKLQSRLEQDSHAEGSAEDGVWLRTGDLGVYIDGQLYITGRIKDVIIVDGRNHYPQDIEATVSRASSTVRSGYVAAFSVPANEMPNSTDKGIGEKLVIIAERAAGAGRAEEEPVVEAIRKAVSRTHGLAVADVLLVAAGSIPRTTSGKLARSACRNRYISGALRHRS